MKKNKTFFIFVFLVVLFSSNTFSQITIGSNLKANSGALLDLKETQTNSSRGLLLPRVSIQNLNELIMGENVIMDIESEWKKEKGLLVYNVNKIESKENRVCPGVHIWIGDAWFPVKSYDSVQERIVEVSLLRNYEYLISDPSNPQFEPNLWPEDKKQDAENGKYMLGHSDTNNTDNLVDVRGNEENTYYVSRFYVGYKTEYTTYEVQKSYKCNSSTDPVWVVDEQYEQMNKIFDDGVWTTQNIRTTKFPDGTDIDEVEYTTVSETKPYYVKPNIAGNLSTYGRFYNWAAVINMGTGVGQIPKPIVDQGGNTHDVKIQGICSHGWHVPSIQELTDMYNGVNLNAPSVSAVINGGASDVFNYFIPLVNDLPYVKGAVWDALRASTMGGNSNLANEGGFYSLPAGRPGGVYVNSYYWTASAADPSSYSRSYGSYIVDNMGVLREKTKRDTYSSVRCMRNTQ